MRFFGLFGFIVFLFFEKPSLKNHQDQEINVESIIIVDIENDYSDSFFKKTLRRVESFYNIPLKRRMTNAISVAESEIEVNAFIKQAEDSISVKNSRYYLFYTTRPIYIFKKEYLLRGFASKNVAIVSSYKIRIESMNDQEYENILYRTTNHEIGHLLGLGHCEHSTRCFMVSSLPSSANFLNSDSTLCTSCYNVVKKYIR